MPVAIELFFDATTDRAVREVWARLAAAGLPITPAALGSRPHVTLAVCDRLDEARGRPAVDAFAAATPPLALALASVGTFATAEGVVFLAPVVTPALLGVHEALHRQLRAAGGRSWDYYLPGQWVPHCTVATDLPADRVGAAVEHCRRLPLPMRGRLEHVGVVAYRPADERYARPLRGPE